MNLGEAKNSALNGLSHHAVFGHEFGWRLEGNVQEEADLQVAVQTPHDLPCQHQMVVVDPKGLLF